MVNCLESIDSGDALLKNPIPEMTGYFNINCGAV
jgi:hypothetical protein